MNLTKNFGIPNTADAAPMTRAGPRNRRATVVFEPSHFGNFRSTSRVSDSAIGDSCATVVWDANIVKMFVFAVLFCTPSVSSCAFSLCLILISSADCSCRFDEAVTETESVKHDVHVGCFNALWRCRSACACASSCHLHIHIAVMMNASHFRGNRS